MAIENSVSNDILSMFIDSIDVFDCPLPGVYMLKDVCYLTAVCKMQTLSVNL